MYNGAVESVEHLCSTHSFKDALSCLVAQSSRKSYKSLFCSQMKKKGKGYEREGLWDRVGLHPIIGENPILRPHVTAKEVRNEVE